MQRIRPLLFCQTPVLSSFWSLIGFLLLIFWAY